MDGDTGEWKTYRQIASALGVSVEAARRRALRGNWRRTLSNSGKTLVIVPDGLVSDAAAPRAPDVRPDVTPDNSLLINAMQAHIDLLSQQLQSAQARIGELTADLEGREAQHLAEITQERGKVAQAHAELVALADRLAALVEANQPRRPWWKRALAG